MIKNVQLFNSINFVLLLLQLLPHTSAQGDDYTKWFDVNVHDKKELIMLVFGVLVFLVFAFYLTWLSFKEQTRIINEQTHISTTTDGLDQRLIETFSVVVNSDIEKFKKNHIIQGTEVECLVCFGEFGDEDVLRLLPCHHVFHAKCIDKWLSSHSTCAVCRFDYKPIDSGVSSNADDAVIDVNHR
ncbi:hypothetical protein MKW92_006456 [Papaver armeniacum]|nr:hypothetical protein MKW92_006456 [Papaver armeniacum]